MFYKISVQGITKADLCMSKRLLSKALRMVLTNCNIWFAEFDFGVFG